MFVAVRQRVPATANANSEREIYNSVGSLDLPHGRIEDLPLQVDLATPAEDVAICFVSSGSCPTLVRLKDLIGESGVLDRHLDLHEIRMRSGLPCVVRATAEGRPVARADVRVGRWRLNLPDGKPLQHAVTDARGFARLPYPIEAVAQEFFVRTDGYRYAPDGPVHFDGSVVPLDLTAAATWDGRVVGTADGRGSSGLLIHAWGGDRSAGRPIHDSTVAQADGSFHLELPAHVRSAELVVERYRNEQSLGWFVPGHDLTLVAELYPLQILVRSSWTGIEEMPIERFGLRVTAVNEWGQPVAGPGATPVVEAGLHPGGEVELMLLRGEYLLQVIPLERAWLPSLVPKALIPDEQRRLVRLGRAAEIIVQVTDANDDPLSKATVEAIETLDGRPLGLGTVANGVTSAQLGHTGDAVCWDAAWSDHSGIASLRVPSVGLAVRVNRDGYVGRIVEPPTPPEGSRLYVSIRMEQAGVVDGVIDFGEGWPRKRFDVVLRRAYDGVTFPPRMSANGPVRIDEDGSFRIAGVPPGAWDVHLVFDVRLDNRPLSTIVVAAGESVSVRFSAPEPHWAVIELDLRSTTDSLPGEGALFLRREEDAAYFGGQSVVRALVNVREAGKQHVRLPPGKYRATFSSGAKQWTSEEVIAIDSETRECVVTMAPSGR